MKRSTTIARETSGTLLYVDGSSLRSKDRRPCELSSTLVRRRVGGKRRKAAYTHATRGRATRPNGFPRVYSFELRTCFVTSTDREIERVAVYTPRQRAFEYSRSSGRPRATPCRRSCTRALSK